MPLVSKITREQKIVQSIQDYARDKLFNAVGYTADDVALVDDFPYERFAQESLDKTYIVSTFAFDDGGAQAELGSTMRRCQHTLHFWVFGLDATWGENVASMLKTVLQADGGIPLKDIAAAGQPQIDFLPLSNRTPSSQQMAPRQPRPYERYLWRVQIQLDDEYDPVAELSGA